MVRRRTLALALLPVLTILLVPVRAAAPAAAGGFCHEPVSDDSNVPVDAKDACFFPSVVHVVTGADVTFSNRDDIEHTVTGQGAAWGGDLPAGQKLQVHFARPGVFPYFCSIHMGMIGAVVVADSSAAAGSRATVTSIPPAAVAPASAAPGGGKATLASSRSTSRSRGSVPIVLGATVLAAVLAVALAAGTRHRRRAASAR